jgi:hypothetical protein
MLGSSQLRSARQSFGGNGDLGGQTGSRYRPGEYASSESI